jgi:hypothetical protein
MPTQRLIPIATQGVTGWTPFGAATCHEAIDEEISNDDTDYMFNNSSPFGIFLMQRPGIQAGTTVESVTLSAYAKALPGGFAPPDFKLGLLIGVASFFLVASALSNTSYMRFDGTAFVNPASGNPWLPSEISRLSANVTMIQAPGFPKTTARVTQLYADIAFTLPTWTERGISAQVA